MLPLVALYFMYVHDLHHINAWCIIAWPLDDINGIGNKLKMRLG